MASPKVSPKVALINLQHARTATAQLLQDLHENSFEILSINEPYQTENKLLGFSKNYIISGPNGPRAALVIHSRLNAVAICSHLDKSMIHICIDQTNFYFATVY